MKKVLVLSLFFAPDNSIGAIRPTKIAKYLKLNAGYDITVITSEYDFVGLGTVDSVLENDLKYVDNHIVLKVTAFAKVKLSILEALRKLKHSRGVVNISSSTVRKVARIKSYHKVYNYLDRYFSYMYGHVMHKNLSKIATKYIIKNLKHFDIIYSSACSLDYYIDIVADAIRQQNPNAFWISNFDDPIIYNQLPKRGIRVYEQYSDKVSKIADAIIGVYDNCIKQFAEKQTGKKYILYNGFDKDELNYILDVSPFSKFTLTYTGHLCDGQRDLRPIFKVISELIEENKINKNDIIINYAGKHENEFSEQASQFGLIENSEFHGFVDRHSALQLQMRSTMLLLASWNKIGYTNVIPGKLFEQLMIDKPILCTITGNLANSKLKEMISDANVGFVWEEATGEQDYPALKAYILEQYERFINGEPLLLEPNREYIEQYDYKYITQQYIDLIEEH